jgi:hypothetical protein
VINFGSGEGNDERDRTLIVDSAGDTVETRLLLLLIICANFLQLRKRINILYVYIQYRIQLSESEIATSHRFFSSRERNESEKE